MRQPTTSSSDSLNFVWFKKNVIRKVKMRNLPFIVVFQTGKLIS